MTCQHRRTIGLLEYRVTRAPNRMRGRMVTAMCLGCRADMPVTWPMGSKSNDRIPRDEMRLAERLAREEEAAIKSKEAA